MLSIKTINEEFKDLIYVGNDITDINQTIYSLTGEIKDKPTRTSIHISIGKHI